MLNYNYNMKNFDFEIYELVKKEIKRQEENIILIASENYASYNVLRIMGTPLSNKYAEGYPFKRYYGGCEVIDEIEHIAIERLKKLFNAEHANVQPHSGTQANLACYLALLKEQDKILSMKLPHGGHLSHGHSVSAAGKYYKVIQYGVRKDTETIDFDEVRELAKKEKPKIIVCGYSAYPRQIDFKTFREIADEVGAYLLADIAHITGLVAAGFHPNPFPYAHIVTGTTHKTLRGPRGGFILTTKEFAEKIDKAVFPGTQGGPLEHVIAAKAVCFKEASEPEFKEYINQVIKNSRKLASVLSDKGLRIVSGGTDTHLSLIDLKTLEITGKQAEDLLNIAGIVVNKNTIPFDDKPPTVTSGIRIGSPCVTTRGMKEKEMEYIGELIFEVLSSKSESKAREIKKKVVELTENFPVYGNIFDKFLSE
ncbi:MAG: serine hydroxymethyltransferase [Candidatus Hydrothermales bacterium]